MKSVIAHRGSDQPTVAELPAIQNVEAGDVRVAVAAAAFTYFDAFVPAHQDALGLPEQVGLGFDFSGTVAEVGPDVSRFAVGDRVAGLHVDITAPVRAHTEELVIEATALAAVPDGLGLDVAAAVPLSALTARQALDLLGPERGSAAGDRCGRRGRRVADRVGDAARAGTSRRSSGRAPRIWSRPTRSSAA